MSRSDEECRLGVAGDRICPQCGAPMSHVDGIGWTCSNGHTHTAQQIAALRAAMLPPRRPPLKRR